MEPLKKRILAGVLVIIGLSAVSVGGYQAWLRQPPAMPENAAAVESLLSSSRYHRLTEAQKQPYRERMNEMWGQLSQDERRRLQEHLRSNPEARDEAMKQQRQMYVNMYVNQTEAGRDVMLDMVINQMESSGAREKMREEATRERSTEEQHEQEKRENEMWEMLDSGDPQGIGYFSEFFKLMEQRRKERGLPPL